MHANHTAATAAAHSFRSLPPRAPLALALAAALTLSAPVAAQVTSTQLPTGGSIAGGLGTIQAPSGATQVITQTSNRMALTWSSFDIGSAATVRFDQPSTNAAVLNLIGGSSASQIFGNLSSNGQVFLINSRGVLFGNTAQVNVGGLVASSLGTTAADFMNENDALDAGGATARVSNSGTITAAAGSVNLIGGQVVNDGTITATAGNITLAGADRATLSFESGGFGVVITRALQSQLATLAVQNTGSLIAPGNTISLQASAASGVFNQLINNSGIISAASLSSAGSDGNVSLIANGATGTSIGGSGSINVDTGSIGYSAGAGGIEQTGVLTAGDLGATAGGNLLLTGSNQIAGIRATVGGNLSVTNARSLGQTDALDVDGTSTFALGSNALTLDNAGNDFTGAVNITAGATRIDDGNALTLGALSTSDLTANSRGALHLGSGRVGGTLAATSNNGAISQSAVSGLTVTGTSNLQAGTGGITLATGSNDFQQTVTLTGGATSIADSNALTLGTLSTGNLTVSSNGDLNLGRGTVGGVLTATSSGGSITQTDVLNVTGTGTINAGGGAIALGNDSNNFSGALTLTGSGITVHDRDNLSVAALTSGADSAVDLFSNATLQLSGFAIDTGTASLRLASNGGALSTAGSVRGGSVSLRARDGITIAHDVTADALNMTTGNAAVNQTAGSVVVATTTTANTGSGAVTLTGAGNNFSGVFNLSAGNVQLNDVDGMSLGTVNSGALTVNSNGALSLGRGTINGALTANSGGGAISQTNALTVTGASTLNAGSGTIMLDSAGNDFQAAVSLTGNGITLRDANALSLAALTTTGNGATQVLAGGTLTLPTQVIDTGTGDLSLTSLGGALTTAGTLTGNNVALRASGALNLAHAIQARGTLGLTSDTAAITQTAGLLDVTGATTATAAAGAGAITLNGTNNDFQGALSLTGGTVLVNDRNALSLGSLGTSALTVASHGNLDLGQGTIGGSLTASSNGGTIGQSGALTLTGAATLDAGSGAIALSNSDNDFQDALALTGTGISVRDRNALRIGALSAGAGGDVTLTAGGGLSLPAQAINIGSGNLSLTAEGGLLGTSGALSANQIRLRGGSGLNLAHDITAADSLTLTTNNAAITQTAGAVTAGALATVDAGTGAIALAGSGNDFMAQLALTGSGITVYDSNDLSIASLSSGSNSPVTLTAGRALSLPVQTIDTGSADLRLSAESGSLLTNGALRGRNVSLNAGAGMALRHDITANGALQLSTADGIVEQLAGTLDVDGTTDIDAGAGNVTLQSPSNVFTGVLSVTGGAVQISALDALTFGTFTITTLSARSGGALNLGQGTTVGTLLARSSGGGITQAGAMTVGGASTVDAGSGAITLNNATNDFQGAVGLTGNGITVTDRNTLSVSSIAGNTSGDIALTAQTLNLPASAISAGTGTLSLTATGSAFSTGGTLSGGNVVLDARDGLTLAHDITAGNLTLRTTNTAINQTAGQLVVGGITDANAGSAAIALTGNNDFQTTVTLTGGAVQLNDRNALTLGTHNTGPLTVTSNGALSLGQGTVNGPLIANSTNGTIGQTGALTINGTSTLNAGNGAITLNNANNDFQGAVGLAGNGITVTDRNTLSVSSIAGNTGGDIALTAQTLNLPASAISAGTGTLSLTATGSAFSTGGTLSGGNVVLDARDGLTLAHDINAGNLTLRTTNAAINQTAGQLTVGGTTEANAGTAAIALAGNNDFQNAVTLTGGAVQLNDRNALTLGTHNTGALTVTSNGALDLGQGTVNGALVASSASDGIVQTGALNITGTSTLNAGSSAITLNDANNDFAGAVTAAGSGIVLVDRNDLQIASLQSGGNASVSLDAGGALQLPTSAIDVGTGALSLTARGGTLTTTHALRGGDVQLSGANGIALGDDVIASGTLSLRSTNAAITQNAGALQVAGNSVVDAGSGAITLDAAGNDFQGLLALTGGATRVRDTNALTLDALDTGALSVASNGALNLGFGLVNGDLDAASNGGAVTQTGALTVTGATRINSAGATIALADAGNDFQSALSLSGGDTRVRDRNGLTLGTLDVGALDVASGAGLNLGQGRIGGTLAARSGTGAAGSTGRLTAQAGGGGGGGGGGRRALDRLSVDRIWEMRLTKPPPQRRLAIRYWCATHSARLRIALGIG
ncbi:filamentous hemagglutinin family N-terminal domain, partial [Xanthomonas vesicatoria ATCC 35937]